MSNRKDLIKKYISASTLLAQSSMIDTPTKDRIISAANVIMNEIWKIEYKSFETDDKLRDIQIRQFWSDIHTELVSTKEVYGFIAYFGETVNPPGEKGNVVIYVKPNKLMEQFVYRLSLKNTDELWDK